MFQVMFLLIMCQKSHPPSEFWHGPTPERRPDNQINLRDFFRAADRRGGEESLTQHFHLQPDIAPTNPQ